MSDVLYRDFNVYSWFGRFGGGPIRINCHPFFCHMLRGDRNIFCVTLVCLSCVDISKKSIHISYRFTYLHSYIHIQIWKSGRTLWTYATPVYLMMGVRSDGFWAMWTFPSFQRVVGCLNEWDGPVVSGSINKGLFEQNVWRARFATRILLYRLQNFCFGGSPVSQGAMLVWFYDTFVWVINWEHILLFLQGSSRWFVTF